MSIFASRTQQTLSIPFDAPHTVTIQKLSGRHLQQAIEANQMASVEALKRMGGAEFQRELAALGDSAATAALIAKRQADPLATYDRTIMLQHGIKAWTYEEPITPETIDDLSEEAAEFMAMAILALTLPARDEGATKNG
jgi:hypothetical protein